MLRASSSTSSTVRPTRSSSELLSRSSMRCFSGGRSVTMRCRNRAVSSSSRSGDSTPLTTMLRAMVWSCASSSAESSRPVNTTTGTSDKAASARSRSSTSKPDMSGSRRSSTTQSHGSCRSIDKRFRAGAGGHDLDVVVAEQLGDAHLLGLVVLHDQQRLRRGLAYSLMRDKAAFDALGGGRLGDERERAARQTVLAILVERDDLHRDVPRQRVLLELAEHGPAEHVGQEHVERHRGRLILLGEIERIGAAHRHQHLEALVAREIDHDARIVRVVLDDQQDRVARLRSSSRSSGICSIARSGSPATCRRRRMRLCVEGVTVAVRNGRSDRHTEAADRA